MFKSIHELAYWFISAGQFVKYFDISLKLVNAFKWVASIRHISWLFFMNAPTNSFTHSYGHTVKLDLNLATTDLLFVIMTNVLLPLMFHKQVLGRSVS